MLGPRPQAAPEALDRVVTEEGGGARGQLGPVGQAGVAGRVEEDAVVVPHERGEHPEVHGVAGGEDEAVVAPEPVEQGLLELAVQGKGAVHETAARAARAEALDGLDRRPLHPLVAGETEVVVGAEHHHGLAVVVDDRARLAAHLDEIGHDVELDRGAIFLDPRVRALGEHILAHGGPDATG